MRTFLFALFSALSIACAWTPAAGAQDVEATSRRAAALRAFEEGDVAAREERWADAIRSFREAYDLTGAPTALFNVAYALRALGRYVESSRAFDELFSLRVPDEIRADAELYRDEVAARIAEVRIEGLDPDTEYELRLDGQVIPDEMARPAVFMCDPGSHRIEVRRAGYAPFEWSATLGEGQRSELEVALIPLPSSNLAEEPWLWIVIGVVVAGGAVIAAVVADDQAQLRPAAGRTVVTF